MKVPNFKIYNEYGCMEFIKPKGKAGLDLTYVDLSGFQIQMRDVSGYLNDKNKPKVGQKLNVSTIVTLYNIQAPENMGFD